MCSRDARRCGAAQVASGANVDAETSDRRTALQLARDQARAPARRAYSGAAGVEARDACAGGRRDGRAAGPAPSGLLSVYTPERRAGL